MTAVVLAIVVVVERVVIVVAVVVFYLTTHSTHFIYDYIVSEETLPPLHELLFSRLETRDLLYAPSLSSGGARGWRGCRGGSFTGGGGAISSC